MKKIIFTFLTIISLKSYSQGWVSPNTSTLHPVNSSLNLTPMNIGIGTNAPSTQFHTTGGVRFQGLTTNNTLSDLLVVDAQNNVFTRSFSSLLNASGTFWSLNGNAISNLNFIGSTNNEDIRFRTNNIQRMILNRNGLLGLGTTNPTANLDIRGIGQTLTIGEQAASNFSSSLRFLTAWGNGPANLGGYAYIQANGTNNNFNNNLNQNGAIRITQWGTNSTPISALEVISDRTLFQGNLGINTGMDMMPTADLDVDATTNGNPTQVRFRNLPPGSGNLLVIDAAGYVRRCNTSTCNSGPEPPPQSEQFQELELKYESAKNSIEDLQKQINQLLIVSKFNNEENSQNQIVVDINPNPTNGIVNIIINGFKENCEFVVFDLQGKEIIKKIIDNQNSSINLQDLTSGTYYIKINHKNEIFCKKIVLQK